MDLTPRTIKSRQPLFDDIVAIRDGLLAEKQRVPVKEIIPGELSDAFALIDPDLALLHKDMKTAAAQLSLAQKSGNMVDMAKWRFESAESAYQTRLMEVRKQKDMKKAAKKTLCGDALAAKRELRQHSMQEEMNAAFALRRKQKQEEQRRQKEKEGGWLFYYLLGMWLANMNAQRRAREMGMSALQHAFFNARAA